MLVDHAARGGFKRRGQRSRSLRDIVVDERLKVGRGIPDEERAGEQEQLRLALAEVADELHDERDFPLVLPRDGRRRMLARDSEVGAVARTADLGEPLGAAAHGADLVAERGAQTAGSSAGRKGDRSPGRYCVIECGNFCVFGC